MREYNRVKRQTVKNYRQNSSIPYVLQEIFEQNKKEYENDTKSDTNVTQRIILKGAQNERIIL